MVLIESGSTDAAGLAKMADYVEARLQALGARTERIAPARGPGSMVKGSFSGSGTRKLMLIAHMDTVYPAGTLASEPYRQDGNKLYGPGIADDKGGIAVILHSLAILKDAGWRDYAQLTVLFNHDEEVGSTTSGETIAQLAEQHDYVFSAEPTGAKAVAKTEGLLLGAAGTATATHGSQGAIGSRGRGTRRGTQCPHRARLPAAADARHRPQHPGRAAELDDGAGGRGQQPDPGEGERPRRRSLDRAGRRRSASRRLAGQGQGRPARRRHRNDGDVAGRAAALHRQRAGARARGRRRRRSMPSSTAAS